MGVLDLHTDHAEELEQSGKRYARVNTLKHAQSHEEVSQES
jgi:hypothetical protein